ncbi:uncharacterized protein LOC132747231 [Ruditapes philippinarum]|uniref:uncharacterized protein LOC132747231 n=1 Tax=Ruditapes philippinarum TaxID=129788 RepID=UPI00295BEE99|nr:uncharacterized protein LOC132747231 [Ruditapes philippinarum]
MSNRTSGSGVSRFPMSNRTSGSGVSSFAMSDRTSDSRVFTERESKGSVDSSYLTVQAGSGSDVYEYSPIVTRKVYFNEKNRISRERIRKQTNYFNAERLKQANATQNREIERQAKEIKRLKDKIEKSEKVPFQWAMQDEKHKNEYKKLSREIADYKREIKTLRGQITELEKEKEQRMKTEKEKNLNSFLMTFVKNTEATITALRNDLMGKMDKTEKNSQKMIHEGFQRLENIIIHGQNGQDKEKERTKSKI